MENIQKSAEGNNPRVGDPEPDRNAHVFQRGHTDRGSADMGLGRMGFHLFFAAIPDLVGWMVRPAS
jgi:hypothetical protein